MKKYKLMLVAAVCGLLAVATSHAADAVWSLTQPTVDNEDIASFVGTGPGTEATNDTLNVFRPDLPPGDDEATYIAGDRSGKGQTFTTGSYAGGYQLNAITVQHATYTNNFSADGGWNGIASFWVLVGEPTSPTTFTFLHNENFTYGTGAPYATAGGNNTTGGCYVTFTLNNPVVLSPNKEYIYSVWVNNSWWDTAGTSNNVYAGGHALNESNGTLTNCVGDRVFHLDIETNSIAFASFSGTPAGTVNQIEDTLTPVITANVVNAPGGAFDKATLYLDGNPVATNDTDNSVAGFTNVVSYTPTSPLAISPVEHTGTVVAVDADLVEYTYEWVFTVYPYSSTYIPAPEGTVPTGGFWTFTNNTATFEAVGVDGPATVTNITILIDGNDYGQSYSKVGTTGTVATTAFGLTHGSHTVDVSYAGSPVGFDAYTETAVFDVVLEGTQATNLVHHWTFDDGAGTVVSDVVGTADGTIVGSNYVWKVPGINLDPSDNGGLQLLGGGSSGQWNPENLPHGTGTVVGAYVDLPPGIITALPDGPVTFEVTFWQNSTELWQRLWDFGNSTSGSGYSDGQVGPGTFAAVNDQWNGQRLTAEVTDGTSYHVLDNQLNTAADLLYSIVHLVVVYDPTPGQQMSKMYVNGELADTTPDSGLSGAYFSGWAGNDVNVWLGRAQYDDPMLNGEYKDFRIYTGIMTAAEALARYNEVAPFVASKVPNIQSITVAGGLATLVWDSETEATYNVLVKSALSDATWSTGAVGVASAGDVTTSTNVAAGASAQFFMIEAQP